MGYRPPKGVRPPQLEGKRTGRPTGSRNFARSFQDALWGFENRNEDRVIPPSRAAWLWWTFAHNYPDQLEEFLIGYGQLPRSKLPR
jgi:hypothetical protein